MEFYQTQMGRAFFERQLPQLIDAVNALAAALSKPVPAAVLPVSADPNFLRNLFFGIMSRKSSRFLRSFSGSVRR